MEEQQYFGCRIYAKHDDGKWNVRVMNVGHFTTQFPPANDEIPDGNVVLVTLHFYHEAQQYGANVILSLPTGNIDDQIAGDMVNWARQARDLMAVHNPFIPEFAII